LCFFAAMPIVTNSLMIAAGENEGIDLVFQLGASLVGAGVVALSGGSAVWALPLISYVGMFLKSKIFPDRLSKVLKMIKTFSKLSANKCNS
jgi:hypothetical protein